MQAVCVQCIKDMDVEKYNYNPNHGMTIHHRHLTICTKLTDLIQSDSCKATNVLCSMLSTSGGCTMAITEKLNYANVCDGGIPHAD